MIEDDGVSVLRFERRLDAPRAAVWAALTTVEGTAAWAFPLDFEPRVGGTVTSDLGEYGTMRGEVLAWQPDETLEYAWDAPEGRWHLVIMLDEGDGTTVLTFDHLAPDPHHPDDAAGWHWHLDRLAQHVAGESPAAVGSDEHFDELQRLYAGTEG